MADLAEILEQRFSDAWRFFHPWTGKVIPKSQPIRTKLNGYVIAQQAYQVLASVALHAELHRRCGVLFFLTEPTNLLVAHKDLADTEGLLDFIRMPIRRGDPNTIQTPSSVYSEVIELLRGFANAAWQTGRYQEFSLEDLPHEIYLLLLQFLAVPQYIGSLIFQIPEPIDVRFRAPAKLAIGSRVSRLGELGRFSSKEAQVRALTTSL